MRRHTNVVKFNLRNINQDAQGSGAPSSVAVTGLTEEKYVPPKKIQPSTQESALKMIIKNPIISKDLEHLLQQHESDESMLKRFRNGHKKGAALKRQQATFVADPIKQERQKLLPMMKVQTGQDDTRS